MRQIVGTLGAEVVALPPDRHDQLVAVVSHVPHLTAASLMGLADERSEEHRALLRLAAGGFRDMTRIASGHPGIWPDICSDNRTAIVEVLDDLTDALRHMRDVVAGDDRKELLATLERARSARVNLPARFRTAADLREVRIPVPDRPGVVADVAILAADLDVNIVDLEIAHSTEGPQGVLVMLIEARRSTCSGPASSDAATGRPCCRSTWDSPWPPTPAPPPVPWPRSATRSTPP